MEPGVVMQLLDAWSGHVGDSLHQTVTVVSDYTAFCEHHRRL